MAAATKKRGPLGSPARLLASEGNERLDRWINRHGLGSCLLLEQNLGRQLRKPWPAPAAERQIIQHLPGELLQLSFAGQRSHGRAPRRTPQPAGGGSRARPPLRCGAQRSQRPHRRARITLETPPDHEEGRSGAPSRAGGRTTAALLTRMAIGGDVIWGRAPGVQHRWASP